MTIKQTLKDALIKENSVTLESGDMVTFTKDSVIIRHTKIVWADVPIGATIYLSSYLKESTLRELKISLYMSISSINFLTRLYPLGLEKVILRLRDKVSLVNEWIFNFATI